MQHYLDFKTKLAERPAAARDHEGCSSVLYALQSRPSGARAICTVRSGGCGGHGPTVILIDSLWGPKTRKHAIFSFGVYIHAMGDLSLSRTHSSPSEPSASSALRVGFVRPASGENKTSGRGMGHPGANPFANGFRDRRCGGTCCGQQWTVGLVPPPQGALS